MYLDAWLYNLLQAYNTTEHNYSLSLSPSLFRFLHFALHLCVYVCRNSREYVEEKSFFLTVTNNMS